MSAAAMGPLEAHPRPPGGRPGSDALPSSAAGRCGPVEAVARLTAPGGRFELATLKAADGERLIWRHADQDLHQIFHATTAFAEREFLVGGGDRVSFSAFRRAAWTLADRLTAGGLRPGDRAALVMPNGVAWPVCFFAIVLAGGVAAPLSPELPAERLAWAVRHAGARLAIATASAAAVLAEATDTLIVAHGAPAAPGTHLHDLIGVPADWAALPEPASSNAATDADGAAAIFYTSGTTGTPKGVVLSHRAMASAVLTREVVRARTLVQAGASAERAGGASAGGNLLHLPLSHVGGCCANLLPAMAGGGKLVFAAEADGDGLAALARREGAGMITAPPNLTAADRVAGAPSPGGVVLQSGGAAGQSAGAGDSWGMTETAGAVTAISPLEQRARPGSCGPPSPVMQLEIRGADGERLPAGVAGELWVRGPQLMIGYWRDPAATAEVLADGWLRSGDVARLDAEGFCYILGRVGDAVRVGDHLVLCRAVETALLEQPGVVDAAVVATRGGGGALALVSAASGARLDASDLADAVATLTGMARGQLKICLSADPLPRGPGGKVSRDGVLARFPGANC